MSLRLKVEKNSYFLLGCYAHLIKSTRMRKKRIKIKTKKSWKASFKP